MAKITGNIENDKELIKSNLMNKEKSGHANTSVRVTKVVAPHSLPIGIAAIVVKIIPNIKAPLTLLITSKEVISKPKIKVTTMGLIFAIDTNVAGLPIINFALAKPIKVINKPMPADIAYRNCFGMA